MAEVFVTPSEMAAMVPFGIYPRADRINKAGKSAEARQLTLAADGAPIRIGYGRDRIGAQIANVLPYNSTIVVQCVWGIAVDSIEEVTFNNETLPAGSTATHYTGSQVAADATLVAAFAAQSPPITYGDVLSGISYSVIQIPARQFSGGLGFQAIVNWRKVLDYRTGTVIGTDNPSLALADFLVNTDYGCGLSVDSASVQAAANWNDTAMTGGEKQRLIGWTLADVTPAETVVETLRTYASVFLVLRGGTVYFVPDKADSSVATYRHADGNVVRWQPARLADMTAAPTMVEVKYTDTTKKPWRERSAFSPEITTQGPRRLSTLRLNGIQRYSQAYREAVERLNKLNLNDLSVSVTVFDAGIKHEAGDIVTVNLPMWATDKLLRVVNVANAGPGLWTLECTEYDPGAYSATVMTAPTYADTTLDNPNVPPVPAGVTATEELYQLETGLYASRARVTITAPTFQWTAGYRVEVRAAGQLIDTGSTASTSYATPALQEGVPYSISVYTLSTTGAASASAATASLTPAGKSLPPGDVATLTGFEAAGDVYLNWSAAVDLDVWRYELRYGATGGTWDSATLIDRVDGLRAVIRGSIAAGTWKFWVKAIDSVGQYSTNAASVTLTVTLDPDSLATGAAFTSPTLTAMTAFTRDRAGATLWVTDPNAAGDKFGALFTSNLSTYSNVLADYHTSVTSIWQSEVYDFGQDVTGDWAVDATHTMLSGTATVTLQLASASAYPTFTDYTSLPTKQTARYVKVKLQADTTETLLVDRVAASVAAVTRKEFGTKTCAATGTNTVTLAGVYSARRRIVLTPVFASSPAARIAVADNIVYGSPSSFDIYLFNDAGTRVAGDVAWAFEGI